MTRKGPLAIVAAVLPLVSRLLAVVAVVSVSGIHLAGMQAVAWALMAGDGDRQVEAGSISRLAVDIVSGAHPCQRCLIVRAASLEQQEAGPGEKQTTSHDAGELRLVPTQHRLLRLEPPLAQRGPGGIDSDPKPVSTTVFPPTPPPRSLARLAA